MVPGDLKCRGERGQGRTNSGSKPRCHESGKGRSSFITRQWHVAWSRRLWLRFANAFSVQCFRAGQPQGWH